MDKLALICLLTLALWSARVALPAYTQEPANTNITPGSSQLELGEVPAGLSADAWSRMMDTIRQDRYRMKPNLPEQGAGYRAAIDSQGLQATFSPTGPVVEPMATAASPQDTGQPDPASSTWEWGLRLNAFGYEDNLQAVVSDGLAAVDGNRLEYAYRLAGNNTQSEIIEWFMNDSRGLEHGFTLAQAPVQTAATSAPLRLQMDVTGSLQAALADAGQAVLFQDERGQTILRHDTLWVTDAAGRSLPAWFSLTDSGAVGPGQHLNLFIDDTGAKYPLTIDPLLTNQVAKLTAADGAGSDYFGYAVSLSGDTVVVGAYQNNSNGSDSGSAYVFSRNQDGGDAWESLGYLKSVVENKTFHTVL